MEQGPTEAFIIQQAIQNRTAIPDKIANAPVLSPGLAFYYRAFLTLSSCRPIGMAEGRIPWTATEQYATRYGLDAEELDLLWTLVCEMDTVYIRFQQKRAKLSEGNKPKPSKDAPRQKGPRVYHAPRKKPR